MKLSKRDKDTLSRHQYLFKSLASVGKRRRDHVLKTAPKSLFSASKMMAKHLIKGHIPLTVNNKKKMTPEMKRVLRQIHASKSPQKTIVQNGAGFSQILRFILPVIGPLLTGAI